MRKAPEVGSAAKGEGLVVLLALVASAVLASAPAQAQAQAQKVVPPKTVHWLSAATQSGFGMASGSAPSAADMMRMASGGSGPLKMLELDLGSRLAASGGTPTAEHAIPPGMGMGASLPLRTPRREAATRGTGPEDFERPKGRLLLFWGCGDAARPGQPLVFDFAKMAAGEMPSNLFGGERVRIARPPSQSGWPTWGRWPNEDRDRGAKSVPAGASLVGAHRVTGNFTPQIDFTLSQDWMQGISMRQTRAASGAVALSWNAVPGATAHFATMMGGRDEGGTPLVVYWSSSEAQTFISGMSDYLAPAEAQRLVRTRQLMPATQTSCAIPKEAVAAAEGGLVMLTSHGPEVNFIHPPRPTDPRQDWVQEWAVKARFVSRAGNVLGMDEVAGTGATGETRSGKPKCKPDASTEAGKGVGGALGGGLGRAMGGALGGLMGSRKKPVEDCEP